MVTMVTFSSTDPDSGVALPADYTFTTGVGGDFGAHTFFGAVTLVTLGDQTLTVADVIINDHGIFGSIAQGFYPERGSTPQPRVAAAHPGWRRNQPSVYPEGVAQNPRLLPVKPLRGRCRKRRGFFPRVRCRDPGLRSETPFRVVRAWLQTCACSHKRSANAEKAFFDCFCLVTTHIYP
jgi:hypothetical protein